MFIAKTCAVCAREFSPNSGRQVTCSVLCRRKHRRALRQQRWSRLPEEERDRRLAAANAKRLDVLRTCPTCGVEFHPRSARQARCSRACVDMARRKPRPPIVEAPPDPEGERRFQEAVAAFRSMGTRPAAKRRRSFYAARLEKLGLPPNVMVAARSLGVSVAAMRRRVALHVMRSGQPPGDRAVVQV